MRRNTPRSGRHDAGGVELCCQIPRLCVPLDPAPGRCARLQHADGARTDDPHQRQRLCHHGDVQKGGEPKKKIKHNTKKNRKQEHSRQLCVDAVLRPRPVGQRDSETTGDDDGWQMDEGRSERSGARVARRVTQLATTQFTLCNP